MIRYELAIHGMDRFFQFIIGSCDYGVRKPHPALFELAAAKLGVGAPDIWFVGDSLECDVAGAKAAGMTSIWLSQNGAAPKIESGQRADATICSLAEVGRLYRESRAC